MWEVKHAVVGTYSYLSNTRVGFIPSSIYGCSISHLWNINSSVWVVWAAQGSKEKKGGSEFF